MRPRLVHLLAPALATLTTIGALGVATAHPTGASALGSDPGARAGGPVVLRPASLPRGEDPWMPHMEGKTIVDGDIRIRVHASRVRMLGPSGNDYVVLAADDTESRVVRVSRDGTEKTLVSGVEGDQVVLSHRGDRVVRATHSIHDRTLVRVSDAVTGQRRARRSFAGTMTVLDADSHRVVLGGWGPNRTLWWNAVSDATRRISNRPGYAADIWADRLATFTRDPDNGGCTVLASLSTPTVALWSSCKERVEAIGPDGEQVATVGILSEPTGPNQVTIRRDDGFRLARLQIAGWFDHVVWDTWHVWETQPPLLLKAHGSKKTATVSCVARDCERASRLSDTRQP